jgi:tRNA A-37 threonylcarbamoyl transferase component Bud32
MFSHFLRKVWPFGWRATASGVRSVRAAGRRWHLTPDAAEVIGDAPPDLERWVAEGRAVVVKTGPHRTVYRVELDGGTVYVKHCRISNFRAWAREVLRPPKARLEFENALALRDRGVPAVLPLAWGEPDSRWPGESFLVTRSRDGVVPFVQFVEQVLPTLPAAIQAALRRQLARTLGEFTALLHDAGVAHPDPHPGNLLVELPASRVPRFYLIDLHAIRVGRPLSWAESRANLVLFNRWFMIRVGRTDRLRFWAAYRRARRTLPPPPAGRPATQAYQVERATMASNLRFWAGRVSRCLGSNRYYRKVRAGRLWGYAARECDPALLRELLADPDGAFARPGVRVIKDSATATVAELPVTTPDGPRTVILKRFNVRHPLSPLKNLLRRSPALRSWVAGFTLGDRWLPTARPLAVFHRYRRGLPAEAYLLTETVPGAQGLPEAVAALRREDREALRVWIDRVARLVRTMHDRAVSHRDLKAPNVLLQGAAADPAAAVPVLIDLVGVRVGRAVSFRQRAKELARLNASFLTSPRVRHSHRLRFLQAYLCAGSGTGASWKDWWRAARRATAAKVAKNRRAGRAIG